MPCRDEGQAAESAAAEIKRLRARLDAATEAACTAITMLETELGVEFQDHEAPGQMTHWWHLHKVEDMERRLKDEAFRQEEIDRLKSQLRSVGDQAEILKDKLEKLEAM